jgi:anti-sigma factor RsiW
MMEPHARIQDDLKAYADGELPLLRRMAVRRHVAGCTACRQEVQQLARMANDLKPDQPDTLEDGLRQRILSAAPAVQPGSQRRPRPVSGLAWACGVAAVAAIAVTGVRFLGTTSADKLNHVEVAAALPANVQVGDSARLAAPAQASAQMMEQNGMQFRADSPQAAAAAGAPSVGAGPAYEAPVPAANKGVQDLASAAPAPAPASADDSVERRVHKEATISVTTDDPEGASEKITGWVKDAGGFVGASDESSVGEVKTVHVTVQVPVIDFEAALDQIEKLGDIQSRHVTGDDITQQVLSADEYKTSLSTQVNETEYRLAHDARDARWNDEQQLDTLRHQLAGARAALKVQEHLADLSDIDLTITGKTPVNAGFIVGLGTSGHDAMEAMLVNCGEIAGGFLWILAYLPFWLPIVLLGRWTWVAYRRRGDTV